MSMVNIAVEDFDIYSTNVLNEGISLVQSNNYNALSLESLSTTGMTSISTEGLIDWAKDKLKKLGQKFVIVINKIVARFSSDRQQLLKNIETYKKNPHARVQLAVSPKTLGAVFSVLAAITAAIVAIFACIPKEDGKSKMVSVMDRIKEQINKVKGMIKKDKENPKTSTVSTEQASKMEETIIAQQDKTVKAVKGTGENVEHLAPKETEKFSLKQSVGNAVSGCHNILHLAKDAVGLTSVAKQTKVVDSDGQTEHGKTSNKSEPTNDVGPSSVNYYGIAIGEILRRVKGAKATTDAAKKLRGEYIQKIGQLKKQCSQVKDVVKAKELLETANRYFSKLENAN